MALKWPYIYLDTLSAASLVVCALTLIRALAVLFTVCLYFCIAFTTAGYKVRVVI